MPHNDDGNDDDGVAMQTRCLYCLREQYAPHVIAISYGTIRCAACGNLSEQMSRTEYVGKLRAALNAAAAHTMDEARPPRQRKSKE